MIQLVTQVLRHLSHDTWSKFTHLASRTTHQPTGHSFSTKSTCRGDSEGRSVRTGTDTDVGSKSTPRCSPHTASAGGGILLYGYTDGYLPPPTFLMPPHTPHPYLSSNNPSVIAPYPSLTTPFPSLAPLPLVNHPPPVSHHHPRGADRRYRLRAEGECRCPYYRVQGGGQMTSHAAWRAGGWLLFF